MMPVSVPMVSCFLDGLSVAGAYYVPLCLHVLVSISCR